MRKIDKLRELMVLDATLNPDEIVSRFRQITELLFESFAIQKADKIYLFKAIEFYFYNKNHRDIITHPRISKELCWYVNDFGGIDLNFASCIEYDNRLDAKGKNVMKYILDEKAYFGGILIRQLVEKESGAVLKGPLACAELFRTYDATGISMNKILPILVECDNGKVRIDSPKPRINILRSNQQAEKKVDNILYVYHEPLDKESLYGEFKEFKEKPYRYER